MLSSLFLNIAIFNAAALSRDSKKILSILIKVIVFILIAWFVYNKVHSNNNLHHFKSLLSSFSSAKIFFISISLFMLMALNWLLECFKWRYLCRPVQQIDFSTSVISILSGLSWAVFTPNRIGEYGGRVFFLEPRKRLFGVVAMGVGAFAQMIITNIIGSLSLCWFLTYYLDMASWAIFLCWAAAITFALSLYLLYSHVHWVSDLTAKVNWLSKVQRFLNLLKRYDKQALSTVFLYSAARYLVFTSQYCLLMQTFIPALPFLPMLFMVFILFFIQSALPSLDLLDVGVRSLTASYFFSFITQEELAVMASAASIWFINLIIPAILGSFFVFKINFFGTAHRE